MKKDRKSFRNGLLTGIMVGALTIGTVSLGGCMTTHSIGSFLRKQAGLSGSGTAGYSKDVNDKLEALQAVIDRYYLYDDEIDQDALNEGIYKGYVAGLNEPYTTYYTKEEYTALEESSSGIYSGIGVLISQDVKTGLISLVKIFPGSPAEEAGLLAEDVISKVAGEEVTGRDLNEVVSHIKGKEGTSVEIEIFRPSTNEYITKTVERRTIEVRMVEYEMLDDQIGYRSISDFE